VRNVLAVLLIILTSVSFANVQGMRLWHAPESSRLVFDLEHNAEHKIFPLSSPSRLVIDIDDAKLLASLKDLPTSTGPIKKVRWGTRGKKDLRIVLDLREDVEPKSFPLPPNQQYGHRLVVDLYPKRSGARTVEVSKPIIDDKS